MKLENNVTTESFEMKNYKLQNYDRMADVIVKQMQQRKQNLPPTVTRQNIVIDARGHSFIFLIYCIFCKQYEPNNFIFSFPTVNTFYQFIIH